MAAPCCTDSDSLSVTETKTTSISFRWFITNYSSHVREVGYSLKSTSFSENIDDPIKWFLVAYPKGISIGDKDYLSVLLNCERDNGIAIPIPITIELAIQRRLSGGTFATCYPMKMVIDNDEGNPEGWGWRKYILASSLLCNGAESNLLRNNTLRLSCELTFPSKTAVVNAGRYSWVKIPQCCLRDNLGSILEKESFSDVKLTAQGRTFNVHKVILAAMSPVFAAMFTSELKEKEESTIEIKDVESSILEDILNFVYTGKILFDGVKQSSEVLAAADKYGLERLKFLCEKELCSNLTVENVLDFLVLAHLHDAKQLKSSALDYATSNIIRVKKTNKWKMLLNTYPGLVGEVFAHHVLYV